jgi:hypothetical protein
VSVCGNTFLSLREGRITRAETVWDVAGLLRAIGLLPELQDHVQDRCSYNLPIGILNGAALLAA